MKTIIAKIRKPIYFCSILVLFLIFGVYIHGLPKYKVGECFLLIGDSNSYFGIPYAVEITKVEYGKYYYRSFIGERSMYKSAFEDGRFRKLRCESK